MLYVALTEKYDFTSFKCSLEAKAVVIFFFVLPVYALLFSIYLLFYTEMERDEKCKKLGSGSHIKREPKWPTEGVDTLMFVTSGHITSEKFIRHIPGFFLVGP